MRSSISQESDLCSSSFPDKAVCPAEVKISAGSSEATQTGRHRVNTIRAFIPSTVAGAENYTKLCLGSYQQAQPVTVYGHPKHAWKWKCESSPDCHLPDCHVTTISGAAAVSMDNRGGSGCHGGAKCPVGGGDCDGDGDCQAGLVCHQRNSGEPTPGTVSNDGMPDDYDVCYDPSTPSASDAAANKNKQCTSNHEELAVRCCDDSGGGFSPGCKTMKYEAAAAHCAASGYRLCTTNELGQTKGSGCDFDYARAWTSSTFAPEDESPWPSEPTEYYLKLDLQGSGWLGFSEFKAGDLSLSPVDKSSQYGNGGGQWTIEASLDGNTDTCWINRGNDGGSGGWVMYKTSQISAPPSSVTIDMQHYCGHGSVSKIKVSLMAVCLCLWYRT